MAVHNFYQDQDDEATVAGVLFAVSFENSEGNAFPARTLKVWNDNGIGIISVSHVTEKHVMIRLPAGESHEFDFSAETWDGALPSSIRLAGTLNDMDYRVYAQY